MNVKRTLFVYYQVVRAHDIVTEVRHTILKRFLTIDSARNYMNDYIKSTYTFSPYVDYAFRVDDGEGVEVQKVVGLYDDSTKELVVEIYSFDDKGNPTIIPQANQKCT